MPVSVLRICTGLALSLLTVGPDVSLGGAELDEGEVFVFLVQGRPAHRIDGHRHGFTESTLRGGILGEVGTLQLGASRDLVCVDRDRIRRTTEEGLALWSIPRYDSERPTCVLTAEAETRILVIGSQGGAVLLDASTGAALAELPRHSLGRPSGACYDDVAHRAYVTSRRPDRIISVSIAMDVLSITGSFAADLRTMLGVGTGQPPRAFLGPSFPRVVVSGVGERALSTVAQGAIDSWVFVLRLPLEGEDLEVLRILDLHDLGRLAAFEVFESSAFALSRNRRVPLMALDTDTGASFEFFPATRTRPGTGVLDLTVQQGVLGVLDRGWPRRFLILWACVLTRDTGAMGGWYNDMRSAPGVRPYLAATSGTLFLPCWRWRCAGG